jgi:hypothetical protein
LLHERCNSKKRTSMTATAWVFAAERGVEVNPLDAGDLAGGVIAVMDGLDRLAGTWRSTRHPVP